MKKRKNNFGTLIGSSKIFIIIILAITGISVGIWALVEKNKKIQCTTGPNGQVCLNEGTPTGTMTKKEAEARSSANVEKAALFKINHIEKLSKIYKMI